MRLKKFEQETIIGFPPGFTWSKKHLCLHRTKPRPKGH